MLEIYQYLTALGVVAGVGVRFMRTAVLIGVSFGYSSMFCWIGGPWGCADALLMTMMAKRYGNRRCIA